MTGQKGIILLPDISGFTRFISETEIKHSQHILGELLEIILEANQLHLSVSEIEGDAVFFYRLGDPPDFVQVMAQSEKMFLKFHYHLKKYKRDRICDCGACITAHQLSLKFIVHYGTIIQLKVKHYEKLMGKDVILAHRLLKNQLGLNEYVLMTEKYLNTQYLDEYQDEYQMPDHLHLAQGAIKFSQIGVVNYGYIPLEHILKNVPEPPERRNLTRFDNPVVIDTFINASLEAVYGTLTNPKLKPEWIRGLKEVILDEKKIPRIGTDHQCILQAMVLDVEVVHSRMEEGKLEYMEQVNNLWLLPEMKFFYILKRHDGFTKLTLEIHYKIIPVIGFILNPFIRLLIKFFFKENTKRFKKFCEGQLMTA